MDARLAIQHAAHVNASTARDTAHVVKLWGGEGLGDLPFTSKLANMSFGLFVNVKSAKIPTAG
jgi:hypothetical protein